MPRWQPTTPVKQVEVAVAKDMWPSGSAAAVRTDKPSSVARASGRLSARAVTRDTGVATRLSNGADTTAGPRRRSWRVRPRGGNGGRRRSRRRHRDQERIQQEARGHGRLDLAPAERTAFHGDLDVRREEADRIARGPREEDRRGSHALHDLLRGERAEIHRSREPGLRSESEYRNEWNERSEAHDSNPRTWHGLGGCGIGTIAGHTCASWS